MKIIDLVILLGWIAFWIYWLVAASGAKGGRTRWGMFAGVRVFFILVVLLLVRTHVLGGHGHHPGWLLAHSNPWLEGAGLAVYVLGLSLAIWARVNIGRNWGMPMSQKDNPELVTSGPYHLIRHPIYSGIILGMIGTALAVSTYWLVAVVLVGGYFIYSAVVEERTMTREFPGSYPQYKQSTKMLIPYIL